MSSPLRVGESVTGAVGSDFHVPTGTVTLLLADVEGSVGLWEAGEEEAARAFASYAALVDDEVGRRGGVRVVEQGEGDSFLAAFSRASDAAETAFTVQRALVASGSPIRPRMAVHTGEVQVRDDAHYVGHTINRCARLRDIAHGGQTVLSQAARALAVDRIPQRVTLVDLGLHRLRDLARPERVYQLCHPELPATFPPLRSLDAFHHNLPAQLTSFVGREKEIAEIRALLSETRLLTLTGTGGCGKTRLALQMAAEVLEEHPDGTWLINLGVLTDAALVPQAVASVLSLSEEPGRDLAETVARYIGQKRMLFVLDNCEHVVSACAALVHSLLQACTSVAIVTTSREPLGVPGETAWRVPSLSVPSAIDRPAIESLATFEAVRLFVDRAVMARPNFRVTNENAPAVAQICQRLDGIPLAVELAAARVRLLTPQEIAEGLDHRFRLLTGGARTLLPRQQTLRASVDWSYDLLVEEEGVVLRRLSVFAGGFTLDAAEEVCGGDGVQEVRILDLVSQLADRSLVVVEHDGSSSRYRLLETIREYAADRLSDSGEGSAVRQRHVDHYLALAALAGPHLQGPDATFWLDRLEADRDNLRAALRWAAESALAEKQVLLAIALGQLCHVRGRYREGRDDLERALASGADATPSVRLLAMLWLGQLSFPLGEFTESAALFEEALALARDLGDLASVRWALVDLGAIANYRGETKTANSLMAQAAETFPPGDEVEPMTLFGQAWLRFYDGNVVEALTLFERGAATCRRSGDPNLPLLLFGSGTAAIVLGMFAEAREALDAAVAVACEQRNAYVGMFVSQLAWLDVIEGRYAQARRSAEETLAAAREAEIPLTTADLEYAAGWAALAEGNVVEAHDRLERCIEAVRQTNASSWLPFYLSSLATVLHVRGDDPQRARALLDEAIDIAREANPQLLPFALRTLGLVTRSEGDLHRAEDLCQDALAGAGLQLAKPEVIDALEAIAGLSVAQRSFEEAARLFAAAQALRDAVGYARYPWAQREYDADVKLAREAMGEDALAAAWAEGFALSMEDAMAYARRGRGRRKRPSAGWESLTPTELSVARLVAEGLSNSQIAATLFVSPRTVQTHLTNTYSKLGFSSRAELAAEATRRGT